MPHPSPRIVFGWLLFASLAHSAEPVDFTTQIRPLLSDRCFACHGPDANKRKADLRLDTKQGAFAAMDNAKSLFAIVPGKPEASELLYRITTDDHDDVMPPPDSNLPMLTPEEQALFERWIEEGAEFDDLWSFQSVKRPEVKLDPGADWERNEIDAFVRATLETRNLKPAPEADRRTLIRRVTLDLTGLPPTLEEIAAFLADESPQAFEKVVDRLLASPRFGERMAVEWMDAARYADTSGYQYDTPRTMWRWRDWVIDAFNSGLPYDDFITWQLAGDLLPDPTIEQQIATGFNRNHPFTIEGGTIDEEYRVSYVADRVTTMGTVFLGLTLECSRCHDHKYDPVSQKDFYQMFAFFNNVDEKGRLGGKPLFAAPAIPTPTVEQSARLELAKQQLAGLRQQLAAEDVEASAQQAAWENDLPQTWFAVRPSLVAAEQGTELQILEDHSVLAGGSNPAREVFTTELGFPDGLTTLNGVMIEGLLDESMPGKGPGRSPNGNAVMTEVEIWQAGTKLPLTKATADWAQSGYPAEHTIDGNLKTGWGIHQPDSRNPHQLAIVFGQSAQAEKGPLKLVVRFESQHGTHVFGRMRYSVSSSPQPTLDGNAQLREWAAIPPEKRNKEQKAALQTAFRLTIPKYRDLDQKIGELNATVKAIEAEIPRTMVMNESKPRETFILDRGMYDQPLGEKLLADTPEYLPDFPADQPRNRLGLATWITDRENPLTARVTVNRLWHQIFGVGIVKTVNDFGSQAELPSHPALLDWLAADFMDSGWDLKATLRTIVTSATYQQCSDTTPGMMASDPENRLLARGPRTRLPAEMVRDSVLFAGGKLVEKIGGPSVKPYQPEGLWKILTLRPNMMQIYEPDTDENAWRRGLYTFWKRASHHPVMSTFDAPNREICTFSRGSTNTPLQALILLHDPQFFEAARGLAQRMDGNLAKGFEIVTSRLPNQREQQILSELFASERQTLQSQPEEVQRLAGADGTVEQAAAVMVARTLLNLSEAITKS